MSPEQILGEPADPRSDLFSLSVVLYELLSGERPFQAADEHNESLRIRSEMPPPLARKVNGLLPGLERVVQRCLEKMPSDRFQTASELLEALEQVARELGLRDPAEAIRRALREAGLAGVTRGGPRSPQQTRSLPGTESMTLTRASAGLFVACVLLVAGVTLVQLVSRRGEERQGAQGGRARLELLPQSVAYLRVVAHPWANVIVDGELVDTTPFARPIPLGAGVHYVRFEHPQAPAERRTVKLSPGETLLLDVSLKVAPESSDAGVSNSLGADAGALEDNSP
jgi:eukaryotic-like serine/threonine-protein kinase